MDHKSKRATEEESLPEHHVDYLLPRRRRWPEVDYFGGG